MWTRYRSTTLYFKTSVRRSVAAGYGWTTLWPLNTFTHELCRTRETHERVNRRVVESLPRDIFTGKPQDNLTEWPDLRSTRVGRQGGRAQTLATRLEAAWIFVRKEE
jgi:hypothetical protein